LIQSAIQIQVTNKYLLDAKELFHAWGFKYRDVVFIWEKLYKNGNPVMGMGWITRRNCELCLIAYKDNRNVKIVHARQKTDVQQLVRVPKRQHLRKPCIFRKLICDLFNGKNKIELFARKYPDSEHFDGWDVWGYESQHVINQKEEKRGKKRKLMK
jgi:N6-adenosine-specific RNA methylase IME4